VTRGHGRRKSEQRNNNCSTINKTFHIAVTSHRGTGNNTRDAHGRSERLHSFTKEQIVHFEMAIRQQSPGLCVSSMLLPKRLMSSPRTMLFAAAMG
jgi:hypothetical protein